MLDLDLDSVSSVVLFRAQTLVGAVYYTDVASLFAAGDLVELARKMELNGRRPD
jgi:hypothetical protein